MRLYRYVGPAEIAAAAAKDMPGCVIHSPDDVRQWARRSKQRLGPDPIIVTFVIDDAGMLLIADRRSEHVACAGGQPILAAGEMSLEVGHAVDVTAVSNQSTGYCPEPESWPHVAEALARAGFRSPNGYSLTCIFRRCPACGEITLVKDDFYECGMCGTKLPSHYNVQ